MNLEDYEAVLKDLTIPPRPDVVAVLFDEMSADSPNLRRVAKTIAADPGISSGLLRAANSPFFGLSRKVSSISQAINLLGLDHVVNIATGLAIRHALRGENAGLLFETFWHRAEQRGLLCHFLASVLRGIPPDEAYTYGLFHDCGIPVLVQRFPRYQEILRRAAQAAGVEAEKELGASHSILGYFLARSWLLPDDLCRAILEHHEVDSFRDPATSGDVRNFIGVGHLAEHIQQRWFGNVNDPLWTQFGAAVMTHFGLTDEDVSNLIDRAQAAIQGDAWAPESS